MTLKNLLNLQDVNNNLYLRGVIKKGTMEFLNSQYFELFLEDSKKNNSQERVQWQRKSTERSLRAMTSTARIGRGKTEKTKCVSSRLARGVRFKTNQRRSKGWRLITFMPQK